MKLTSSYYSKSGIKCTPLHLAAEYGFISSIKKLIEKGANIDALNSKGQSPLHMAAQNGRHLAVRVLLYYGANINQRVVGYASTALLLAVKTYLLDLVRKNERTNIPTFYPRSVGYSIDKNSRYEETIGELVMNDADVHALDSRGHSAVSYYDSIDTRSLSQSTCFKVRQAHLRILQIIAFEGTDAREKENRYYNKYGKIHSDIDYSLHHLLRSHRSQTLKDNALYYLLDLLNDKEPALLGNLKTNEKDKQMLLCEEGLEVFFKVPAEIKKVIMNYVTKPIKLYGGRK